MVMRPEVGTVLDPDDEADGDAGAAPTVGSPSPVVRSQLVRRWAMRPRRVLVKAHRWLAIALIAWVIVIGLTGAWLVDSNAVESWMHHDRYRATAGDVGPDAALSAATAAMPEGASVYGLTMPVNGRGVYQVYGEGTLPEDAGPTEEPDYYTAYVDPGTGEVNGVRNESEGATNWLYRGHMTLWQDHGIFGVFDADHGWCRPSADGVEPGGVKGVVCDVIPDGEDMVGWFAIGFIVILVTGFYLWYWPGVRRWATALAIKRHRGRFAFHMSVHKVVGLVVWVPLVVISFTGAAFAFPNMNKWFDNSTPAARDFDLWVPAEDAVSGDADGRETIGYDEARAAIIEAFPQRTIHSLFGPFDETGTYTAWVSRGFDPWTREGGAGNTYVGVDRFDGHVVYDLSPEDGNVFDQAWDDWSFPLHTGDFGGAATRVVWTLVGLSPLVLAFTGVVMNLVRRQKRRRRRPFAPTATPA